MGEARVVRPGEGERRPIEQPGATSEVRISPQTGSVHIIQSIYSFDSHAHARISAGGDEVLYVIEGEGELRSTLLHETRLLRRGVAALIRDGQSAVITAGESLEMVSVVSPPPRSRALVARGEVVAPFFSVHEDDRRAESAGEDREFKVLIETKHVTQFVGFIRRSKAPPHTHTYEEAIYILEGEGIVHIGDDRHEPIRPGTSIFLPPGTPHWLENRGERTLKLLGVFSPPGSPANHRDAQAGEG